MPSVFKFPTVTFWLFPEAKSFQIIDKKPLINAKAKVYDTFTPTIECVYNKITQKFGTDDVRFYLV